MSSIRKNWRSESIESMRGQLTHWNRELEIRLSALEKVIAAQAKAEQMVKEAQVRVDELAVRIARSSHATA